MWTAPVERVGRSRSGPFVEVEDADAAWSRYQISAWMDWITGTSKYDPSELQTTGATLCHNVGDV